MSKALERIAVIEKELAQLKEDVACTQQNHVLVEKYNVLKPYFRFTEYPNSYFAWQTGHITGREGVYLNLCRKEQEKPYASLTEHSPAFATIVALLKTLEGMKA